MLHTTSGERLIVSASTSSALAEVGAAIVSFRDVTLPRALEAELQRTKDFLERLIDSTVDGIVAADLRGRVILFNKGAARLTGWTAEETTKWSSGAIPGHGPSPPCPGSRSWAVTTRAPTSVATWRTSPPCRG